MLHVSYLRHAYPEKAGFFLNRPSGHAEHTFLHFFGSVSLLVHGKKIQTEPHACIVYPAGEPQFFYSEQPLTHDWIHFTGDTETLHASGIRENTVYYPDRPEIVTELTRELEKEKNIALVDTEILCELKLKELFVRLARAARKESFPLVGESTEEALRSLRGEVFTKLNEPWTVQKMATTICLSESRFYFLYRSTFGISPIEDLIAARIDAAKNALLLTQESVSEIAERLGYRSASHFSRQFKTETGLTPSQFRNK